MALLERMKKNVQAKKQQVQKALTSKPKTKVPVTKKVAPKVQTGGLFGKAKAGLQGRQKKIDEALKKSGVY